MPSPTHRIAWQHRRESPEAGYLLLTVLVLVALLALSLAVAAPKMAQDIQRDKETEAMHRGMQYARAIRLYYKKFGSYPANLKQLENTNNIRFLRRKYTDPITGKDDWTLIHVGESKVPPMGLFGKPLQENTTSVTTGPNGTGTGASPGTGTPPGTSNGAPATGAANTTGGGAASGGGTPVDNGSSSSGSDSSSNTSTPSPSSGSSSGFGSQSGFGSSPGFGSGSSGFGSGSSGSGPSGSSGISFGASPGSSSDGSSSPTGSGINATGGSLFGSGQQGANSSGTFGEGGPIVGVGIPVKKLSIRQFKNQKHYNEWEFVYDPQQDQGGVNGQTGAGVVAGQDTNGIAPTGPGFGNSGSGFGNSGSGFGNSGSGFGNSGGGFGSSPTAPTSPTTGSPQQ